ncbi:hypothetical protein LCGC14_0728130 [marine sediment metagenome]|uniref:Uncharacterized protein n=1 Tax=marine sediment metagenome TaxID=412755 RepID=A0A0F9QAE3_9ZZZZ
MGAYRHHLLQWIDGIEALQYDGTKESEGAILEMVAGATIKADLMVSALSEGDWVIRRGSMVWVVNNSTFQASYEEQVLALEDNDAKT